MTTLLEVDNLSKQFRGLRAVSNVSFSVPEGAIVALIGPNGAGKTTTFNLIAGVMPPNEGEVRLAGRRLTGLRPDQVCAAGVGRTFQLVKPFGDLSVEDNVLVGALHRRPRIADARRHAVQVLELLELGPKRHQIARGLTLPERKRLEVARALATEPRILLLDEVMAGLRPTETDRLVEVLRDLNRDTGMTILLIEHVMRAVMALSSRVVVLDHGVRISEGAPAEVVADPKVIEVYLGSALESGEEGSGP
ncbi:ABC transporter [Skermanella stibiiresistens SB22]|uniref:ABC transporter n=1 Tax=Skermanella stibiiresistens SB22 TaxID=1385369 RepID=W9H127_9PROT|nr:ABC transporter ATP-binding protein [Skermanella stibiiresistens]EWY39759.1 ABC transporter [Skermanella stibiiresistens SB22]